MRYFLVLLFVLMSASLIAQEEAPIKGKQKDTTQFSKKRNPNNKPLPEEEITIKDYKIISHARDTTYLDTTLTIQKEYRYNYLRRDDFELMPFANVGQPYNKLGVNFERVDFYPKLGAKAKHFNYLEKEQIDYYNVATPMSDLFLRPLLKRANCWMHC